MKQAMVKKRCSFVLFVMLFVFIILAPIGIIPCVYAMECLTYEQCDELDCIGAARGCVEGVCVYTDCVTNANAKLSSFEGYTQNIDVEYIVSLMGKMFFLILIAAILALIFSIPNLHGKERVFAIVGFTVTIIILGVFLFYWNDITMNKTQDYLDSSQWDPHRADSLIHYVLEKEPQDIEEHTVSERWYGFKGGKEYKLKDGLYEKSVVILELTENTNMEHDLDSSPTRIGGQKVKIDKSAFHDKYTWVNDELLFVVSGEKEESRRIVRHLILGSTVNISTKDIEIQEQETKEEQVREKSAPPVINVSYPVAGSYISKSYVSFGVYDIDSEIDKDTIFVEGAPKFSMSECTKINNKYSCITGFNASPGKQNMIIMVSDMGGETAKVSVLFVYDKETWQLEMIYPTDSVYTNVAMLKFRIIDIESGINLSTFNLTGLNISLDSCQKIKTGVECEYDSLSLNKGKNNITIEGYDNARSYNKENIYFYFDKTRPVINFTGYGFLVYDNIKLKNNSLFIDKKRYSLSDCDFIDNPISGDSGEEYMCRYDKWIREISVMDEAGNSAFAQQKQIR